jgi:Ca2+-binding EF-hand superfamily protein
MTFSSLLDRKFRRMFAVLDVNRDGVVDRRDFLQRTEACARLRGWSADTPEYERNLGFALDEWSNLRESADADDDAGVTEAEFLRYARLYLTDRDAVRAHAHGDAQLLFDTMDTDGDGRVTAQEYGTYLEICGVDRSAARAFFAHADLNEDGVITRDEMTHAVEEFLVSEDPAAGGNYLYGALDVAVTP